ncbi:hypothetical protein BZG36_04173 [Bifiguratus adelaidae]|uniref:PSI domain-containing protein n=1 Tax=Bifiguratus adelaidae TaxID=1938954 RepID=A0A261XYU6_9FUNG|nr:hypothetical protein BZG36_04173 [Bifiguratus adelaidae]
MERACSQLDGCGSCATRSDCGFCRGTNICVPGYVLGPINTTECKLSDYTYRQCAVPHLHAIIVVASILGALFLLLVVWCACKCCRRRTPEQEPLLPNPRYLRRSSTYYQWNRAPPEGQKRKSLHGVWQIKTSTPTLVDTPEGESDALFSPGRKATSPSEDEDHPEHGPDYFQANAWEQKRSALLKKYGRSFVES